MEAGALLFPNYRLVKRLAVGGEGSVWLVESVEPTSTAAIGTLSCGF